MRTAKVRVLETYPPPALALQGITPIVTKTPVREATRDRLRLIASAHRQPKTILIARVLRMATWFKDHGPYQKIQCSLELKLQTMA